MISAGRVLIMPRGDYNPATTYSMLDLVSYNGSSYIAKQSTTGNAPTNTTYWQLSAYGGSATNLAGNFAYLETTDYATKDYVIDDFLVTKDSKFCKVIASITTGDELVIDEEGNLEVTSVGELIQAVIDYADSLDANNVQLKGMTAITVQTDLNDLTTIGNYYKSATNIYVTNAPTGIASETSAVFRLTVENGSDTTNKYIQTLRTNDGKIYTRGYNGSAWGAWIEIANAANVSTLDGKAYKTDDTTENTLASDDVLPFYDTSASAKRKMTVQKFGEQLISNPNLLDNPWFTVNQRGFTSEALTSTNVKIADRWKCQIATGSASYDSDNGVTIDNTSGSETQFLVQNFEEKVFKGFLGKTFTLSVQKSDGTIVSGAGTIPSTYPSTTTSFITLLFGNDVKCMLLFVSQYDIRVHFQIPAGQSLSLRAVKLELGSVSTLAMDTAPNYATELLKCQRYFQRIKSTATLWLGYCTAWHQNRADMIIYLPITLRVSPSIVISNINDLIICKGANDNNPLTLTQINFVGLMNNIMTIVLYVSDTLAIGDMYTVKLKEGYIDLSADL